MLKAGTCLILFGFLLPAYAQEPAPKSTATDSQIPQSKTAAGQAKDTILGIKPGSPVLKNKDLYDQTGFLHPFVRMPRYVLLDQKAIWTSPFHTSKQDLKWWLIFGGATGALIAADKSIEKALPSSSTLISVSKWSSDVGSVYSLIPISAAFYLTGTFAQDEKFRETGLLSFESLIDTELAGEALKLIADRSRPYQDSAKGRFEDNPSGRWNSGFPSGHAISSWAVASIIAHEYSHRRIVPILAYALASTVAVTRVGARKHFPGDVLAGSAMGWFIGDFVYGKRHNEDLDRKKTIARAILSHIRIGGD